MQSTSNNSGPASGTPGAIGSEISSDVQQLSSTASDRIHSELDARKGTAAEQAKSASRAIGRAADELGDGAPQWLRSAFQQGAQQVQRLADALEQKDSRQIVGDIQTIARNNPGTFLAGCAALGFAAARIFKAGAPEATGGQSRPAQFPPVQVDEPMIRSSSPEGSLNRAGEFV